MIVAIYVQRISFVLPVDPVGRVEKPAPQHERQQQPRQESTSFAAILNACMRQEDMEDASTFGALV